MSFGLQWLQCIKIFICGVLQFRLLSTVLRITLFSLTEHAYCLRVSIVYNKTTRAAKLVLLDNHLFGVSCWSRAPPFKKKQKTRCWIGHCCSTATYWTASKQVFSCLSLSNLMTRILLCAGPWSVWCYSVLIQVVCVYLCIWKDNLISVVSHWLHIGNPDPYSKGQLWWMEFV